MEGYYFLFGLGLIAIAVATFQDLKKTEVENWLTYSLIFFALAYKAFYSIIFKDAMFFYGILGFLIFFALAWAFYYGQVFAGGDAKLFMGIGALLPFGSYYEIVFNSVFFIFLLFFLGAIYSVLFSFGIMFKNFGRFKKEFIKRAKGGKAVLIFILCFEVLLLSLFGLSSSWFLSLFILIIPILYFYLKALESGCLIRKTNPAELTDGDWLEKDVCVNGKWIRKSVHGLSSEDIKILKKARKDVWIKSGIPFVPAFLFAFLVMGYVFLVSGLYPESFFWFLS